MDGMKKRMDAFDNQDEKVTLNMYNQFVLSTTQRLEEHNSRGCEHHNDIKLLKEMGAPSGGDGNSVGLLDAFKDMID